MIEKIDLLWRWKWLCMNEEVGEMAMRVNDMCARERCE